MREINGKTKILGVIGWPVAHSLSPKLHNYICEKMGDNYVYTAIPVKPDEIGKALEGMKALHIAGLNATVPHKYAVMPYLDVIDEAAMHEGSVNTIVNRDGRLYGYSTDARGFYESAVRAGIDFCGKSVLLLGAGGAAKPICVYLAEHGVKSIDISNRTQEKAQTLAGYVTRVTGFPVSDRPRQSRYDIVINATSAGMAPDTGSCALQDFSVVDQDSAAIDIVYTPEKTVFLERAQNQGAKILNGLGMLVYQGILAYELFTGTKVPEDMYEELKEMLKQ